MSAEISAGVGADGLLEILRVLGVECGHPDREFGSADALVTLALSNILLDAAERQVLKAEEAARTDLAVAAEPRPPQDDPAVLLRWRAARLAFAIRNTSRADPVLTSAAHVAYACTLLLECEAALSNGHADEAPEALWEASEAVREAVTVLKPLINRSEWP